MFKLLFLVSLITTSKQNNKITDTSIYNYQITTIDDSVINLSSFAGKNILFVNTALNSKYASQYASLDSLYQLKSDSLVIIAFPSNDFGNEPNDDSTIKNTVVTQYNVHYILAKKVSVKGDSQSTLYQWLTQASLNGVIYNPIEDDFYKFLIDSQGHPKGVFESSISPMDDILKNSITN